MEILAPAGSFASLRAAISGGADAVYVGGSRFSARKNAANFDDAELLKAVDYCHLRDKKIYVAINTMIKENEYKGALSFLEYVRKIGVDAVILSDLGLISAAQNSFCDLRINASTQLTIHSTDGVKKIAELGAKRVVLARELSFDEISKIRKNTDTELEVFVHGALCMSYSGQCLFSSVIGGRSGNRGACAQPCRLSYSLFKGKERLAGGKPLLSPKDLCLIKNLDRLSSIGVDSLKIEGRMKSPEYVWLVSRAYSNAKKYGYNEEETKQMLAAFSRGGSSNGFFYGKAFEKMMDYGGEKAKISKEIKDIKIEEKNDFLPITMHFSAEAQKEARLTLLCKGQSVEIFGRQAEIAEKVPLSDERAAEQLKKLGNTSFYAESISCDIKDSTALPIKEINEMRRRGVELLEEKICAEYRREEKKADFFVNEKKEAAGGRLTCEVLTKEQAEAAKEMGIKDIYVPICEREKLSGKGDFIYLLPPVQKDDEEYKIYENERICVQNIGQIKQAHAAKEIFASHRFNISNRAAIACLEACGVSKLTISPELNKGEIKKLAGYFKNVPELVAYGRLPLMVCENCFIKSAAGRCVCKDGDIVLKDRTGSQFPVLSQNCRNIILNSKRIFIADIISEFSHLGCDFKLMFTIEKPDEVKNIIKMYKDAIAGVGAKEPISDFTRGHFARGVM